MKRNEIIFIIILLAIVSIAIGMTQPTKIPFLKLWESSSKAAPDGKGALKLDENGILSGISISAEDLNINGKLTASSAVVGTETLSISPHPVSNPSVSKDSQIFITINSKEKVTQWLVVYDVTDEQFVVRTNDNEPPSGDPIDFSYLIIN